ncbi:MYB DNA-binding-like protein [Alternaria alternata]|nr:MYB DNA-binding-like protein [Alternaria alternata]
MWSPSQSASPTAIPGAPAYPSAQYYTTETGYMQATIPALQKFAPMLGGPVQPATRGLGQHGEPAPLPNIRSLWSGPYGPSPPLRTQSNNHFPPTARKRKASSTPLSDEHAAKKQSKWTPEEDNLIIQLRGRGIKWDDIAKHLPGRSSISCRLRYQNYLEKRAIWDDEKKNKLARCYERFKEQIWQPVATQMGIPWRSAEWMHWQLGEQEMSARAKATVLQPHPSTTSTGMSSSSQVPVAPASAPYGFTPFNAPQSTPQLHQVPPPMSQGPVPEMQSAIKRETENPNYTETYYVRERNDKAAAQPEAASASNASQRKPDEKPQCLP